MASREKKDKTKTEWRRQKNKKGDSRVESNDSPEIPDRRETSDSSKQTYILHKNVDDDDDDEEEDGQEKKKKKREKN